MIWRCDGCMGDGTLGAIMIHCPYYVRFWLHCTGVRRLLIYRVHDRGAYIL